MADQIVVSESALGYLQATRPWVKFLSIVGFVFIGLMLLGGLAMFRLPTQPNMPAAFGPVFGVIYILMAAVYVMPCLFMYRYAQAISAIPGTGQGALEQALKNQKSFWKFMGIFMIVVLSLYALLIVGGIVAVILAVASHH